MIPSDDVHDTPEAQRGLSEPEPLSRHGDPLQPAVEASPLDPEMQRLEREIAESRENLAATMDAIESRLAPSQVVERAKASVKDAAKERIRALADTAAEAAGGLACRTRRVADEATATLREHPHYAWLVAAGMVCLAASLAASTRAKAAERDVETSPQLADGRPRIGRMPSWALAAAGAGAWIVWRRSAVRTA
jgi:ElaB/YqjD/DUF883 family membrane-anchored ribosome-binding protein